MSYSADSISAHLPPAPSCPAGRENTGRAIFQWRLLQPPSSAVFLHLVSTSAYERPKKWEAILIKQKSCMMFGCQQSPQTLQRWRLRSAMRVDWHGRDKGRRKLQLLVQKLEGTALRKEELLRSLCDIVQKVVFQFSLRHRVTHCTCVSKNKSVIHPNSVSS